MTLSQMTHGNFILGIGLSSPNIVHDWAGQPYERPLTTMREHVEDIRWFVDEVRADGITDVVLLGMGGSSLAPEVFQTTFGSQAGIVTVEGP